MGVDANVSLPGDFGGITGSSILPPARGHSHAMVRCVLSWFVALGVRVLNTLAPSDSGNAAALWTCGQKRQLERRTQIDFIAASAGIRGVARPTSMSSRTFRKSDHRPVVGVLGIPALTLKTSLATSVLKGGTSKQ